MTRLGAMLSSADVTAGIDTGSITPAMVGVPLARNLYRSGLYYGTPVSSAAAALAVNNQQYWTPMWIQSGIAFDRIATNFTIAGAPAGCTIRLGIYDSDASGVPSNVLVDGGTGLVDGTPADVVLTISWTCPSSTLYWLTALAQGATGTAPTCAFVGAATFGAGRNSASGPSAGYVLGGRPAGALQATNASILTIAQTNVGACPRVVLRAQ